MVSKLMVLEVDKKNITALMRYANSGSAPFDMEQAFIEGGTMDYHIIKGLLEADIPSIVASLKPYIDLSKPFAAYQKDGSLVHFEVELENRIYLMGLILQYWVIYINVNILMKVKP